LNGSRTTFALATTEFPVPRDSWLSDLDHPERCLSGWFTQL